MVWRNGILLQCGECKLLKKLWKTLPKFLKIFKIELLYIHKIYNTLGYLSKEHENTTTKR